MFLEKVQAKYFDNFLSNFRLEPLTTTKSRTEIEAIGSILLNVQLFVFAEIFFINTRQKENKSFKQQYDVFRIVNILYQGSDNGKRKTSMECDLRVIQSQVIHPALGAGIRTRDLSIKCSCYHY